MAALAGYIKENGLGVVIDSLCDIPACLARVTEEDYHRFLMNLDKERALLIKGEHLRSCLT